MLKLWSIIKEYYYYEAIWSFFLSKKFLDRAKKSVTDVIKTASEGTIQKTAEATGDIIGNNISVSKRSSQYNLEIPNISK